MVENLVEISGRSQLYDLEESSPNALKFDKSTNKNGIVNIMCLILLRFCDKFILLATNSAVESKWCNWELGYGDAQKYREHIALFPMKPKDASDFEYRGSEYMQIYPYICYFNGTETYTNGNPIIKGYYVRYKENDSYYITPLENWFKS